MRQFWTDSQIQTIKDKYINTPTSELAVQINRSIHSIHKKAFKLGIKRDYLSDAINRFMTKFIISNNEYNGTPCWEWEAAKDQDGYGRITINNIRHRAYKWAYEYFIGPIEDGLQLDHLCRNRACVNVLHLEPVTQSENMARGFYAMKTHCVHGHEFTDDNIYFDKYNHRHCKTCILDNSKKAYYGQ